MTTLVEAETLGENLLSFVDRASDGEEFIVTRAGVPHVRPISLTASEQDANISTTNTPAE